MKYSHTINSSYLANCCDHCDSLQGDFFLFEEFESPFFVYNKETAEKLKLYKIPLDNDIITDDLRFSLDTENMSDSIKHFSTFLNSENL